MLRRGIALGSLLGLLLLGALSIATLTSYAQLGGGALNLIVTPEYPRPFQTVTVVPQSSTIDLSASTLTITVDGRVVSEGSGAEAAYVTLGGAGTATTVTVRAVNNGQTYTSSVTIRPADVALVIEPVSSAHPFYEGGSLISSEGQLRIIALSELRGAGGALLPPASLVYTWRNGDQILESASGIGKSVLTATAPGRYRDARITVTVTTQDRSVVAEAATTIAPTDPFVRVYRNDPLLGPLYNAALPANLTLLGEEEGFRAVPYHFPGIPSIAWSVNGTLSETGKDITVRSTGNGTGTARLTAVAQGGSSKPAETTLSLQFGERRGFGIFGL